MRAIELITDAVTGQLSESKLWGHIGKGAATVAFLYQVYERGLESEMLFVYLGLIAGSTLASKFVSMKWGQEKP